MNKFLLSLLFFFFAATAQAAVAISGSSVGTCTESSAGVLSWTSHNITGDRLFVALNYNDASATVTSITNGAQSLIEVEHSYQTTYTKTALYSVASPTLGTNTITVALSGAPIYGMCAFEFAVSGAGTLGTPVTAADFNTVISLDVTGAANGMVIDVMGSDGGLTDAAPTQTIIQSINSGGNAMSVGASYSTATGSVTMGWSWSAGNQDVSQVGILINPSSGVGATTKRSVVIVQ